MPMKKKIAIDAADIHVGNRIRIRRMQLGLSQSDLAKPLGYTFQQVQKYEKATNRVSASAMVIMANALDVEPNFFFEGVPGLKKINGAAPDIATAMLASRDGIELAEAFPRIKNLQLRRLIVDLVQRIAG